MQWTISRRIHLLPIPKRCIMKQPVTCSYCQTKLISCLIIIWQYTPMKYEKNNTISQEIIPCHSLHEMYENSVYSYPILELPYWESAIVYLAAYRAWWRCWHLAPTKMEAFSRYRTQTPSTELWTISRRSHSLGIFFTYLNVAKPTNHTPQL